MGEAKLEPLRVDFDRRLKLEFHGSDISSDGGLFPYRELDHALELTELGDYLAMPVRTYSTGMVLRLAFAVSTCIDPEILLMDEWISMGDAHFLKKAERRMETLIDRSRILVIASHSPELIRRTCTKAILLDNGRMVTFGKADQVIEQYREHMA